MENTAKNHTCAEASTAPANSATPDAETKCSDDWVLVYDAQTERDYYFNIHTEESLWEAPKGLEGCPFRRYEEALQEDSPSSEEEEEEEESQPSGWHYIDMTGQPQGPFQKEQLQQWRAHFPMNTLLWRTEQMHSEQEEDKSTKKATFLADILGDDTLLRRWQIETPNSDVRLAPSAADYQLYLDHPILDRAPVPEEPRDVTSSTEQAYAEAVLAGLPPEDETVQLADLAKQSGTPLKDIVRFVETAASDGSAEQLIVTDPRSGKMTAVRTVTEENQQLYGEFGSWIDPSKMAAGLQKSAQYRREKLPSLWMKQVGYKKRTLPWQDERYDREN